VIPDDIKALADPALAHRLIVSPAARLKNVDPRAVIDELIHSIAVPGSRAMA
jgi:MoxR-like ATPase